MTSSSKAASVGYRRNPIRISSARSRTRLPSSVRSRPRPYPLDDLVAQTQGMIGYWLAQALRNAGVRKPILGLLTPTMVDSADPAFASPTKFIGPVYARHRAQTLADRHGWTIAADNSRWRRVVASPEPQRIIEQDSITELLDAGAVVICGGGGARQLPKTPATN